MECGYYITAVSMTLIKESLKYQMLNETIYYYSLEPVSLLVLPVEFMFLRTHWTGQFPRLTANLQRFLVLKRYVLSD
jgi:hypothetical protein